MIGSLFFCSHDLTEIIMSIINKCCPIYPRMVPYSAWGDMQKITAIFDFRILILFPHKRKGERNW